MKEKVGMGESEDEERREREGKRRGWKEEKEMNERW